MDNPTETRPAPLAGIRVLDLSRLLPGPLCAQHLSDLGAEVIKIEDTAAGDYARPAVRELVNRGKKAVQINLKTDAGKEILKTLAKDADVVLESFRPGTMTKLGVGYEELRSLNPRLVFCSITGYGQTGPRRNDAGHDLNFVALTGVLDQTGRVNAAPAIPGFLLGDILGGTLSAAVGILAALFEVRSTGKGRMIDVSMADAVLSHSILPIADLNDHHAVTERGCGTHTGGTPHYNVYETADNRFLAIAAQEKKFWDIFCETIDRPELKAGHGTTRIDKGQVKNEITEVLKASTLAQWLERFDGLDCCITPVLSINEAVEDAHFRSRKTIKKIDSKYRLAPPFQVSQLHFDLSKPSPKKGEHTDELLKQIGYSQDYIAELRKLGVVA